MMAVELVRVTEFIESRWGSTSKAWFNTQAMVEEFRGFTAGAVLEACQELFREGTDYTPKPSLVRKRVGAVQARRYDRGEDVRPDRECKGNHVWATIHYPGETVLHKGEQVPKCLDAGCVGLHRQCSICHEELT